MYLLFMAVALFACLIGKICGMGGGVIIKPVLDAFGILSVSSINFLSGCTVIGMSCWSVLKGVVQKDSAIDWKVSTPLALGAAAGGIAGKQIYGSVSGLFSDPNTAGGVQAVLLLCATGATLVYTIHRKDIVSRHVTGFLPCMIIGLFLGMLGAFLGIGGGPFNMAVLYYFFSMETKTAAQNSLYIILISQLASLLNTVFSGKLPEIILPLLLGMVFCGILGSEFGSVLNKKLDDKMTTVLFECAMVLVMGICVYNAVRFF